MPINIDYTTIDFDALKEELIQYLKDTKTYKDVDFASSNIKSIVELYAYLGSLFGYYINSVANEPFLPSAKRYKNLNRIARLLNYNPRGNGSASVPVVGSLLPEYCYGKEGVYFEIPAYSSFPSTKPTSEGTNFSFTNEDPFGYVVQSFGARAVEQNDISYNGFRLPLTKAASYWTAGTSGTDAIFDPTKLVLSLSDTIPMSILNRLDTSNYKKFDVDTAPLFDPSDPTSVGQPFVRSISVNTNTLRITAETIYYIVFNYDTQTSTPYLTLMEEGTRLEERKDDVILSIKLHKEDASGTYYTLQEVQNNAKGRFYLGVMGLQNLDSVKFSFDKLESVPNGIKQIHLDVNKSGDKPPFLVLVDGVVYTFNSGRISSQIFDVNSWDSTQAYYNINLNIVSPDAPTYNYDATLTVTSKDPGTNEITIARIYPAYIDPESSTKALTKDVGQRFGNFQAVPSTEVTSTEQKSGIVTIPDGVTKLFVPFTSEFVKTTPDETIDYILQLTPSDNILIWYSDKSETGFSINIESNTGFTGTVSWVATRYIEEKVKIIPVVFDTPIPQIGGVDADYSIFLTASDNVVSWYTNKTSNGFDINIEKDFNGTVSYSTFVYSSDESVVSEQLSATQKKGSVTLYGTILTRDITFDTPFSDNNYGLHMIANKNVNTWYTNKTSTGFTINVEPNVLEQDVTIDWYADYSPTYVYQKHGMVTFSGQITSDGTIPGLRFTNVAETFIIPSVTQGNIKFSYINKNGVIDVSNNNLSIEMAADRRTINEIKFNITDSTISYSNVRVFVKNDVDVWEEWNNGTSLIESTDVSVGTKVFFVRVNEYKQVEVSFGDGISAGTDPVNHEIFVLGLESVGSYGNIPPNTLSPSVILSKTILGDDDITLQFEQQFIQLLGLKNADFFASGTNTSSLYDTEGTQLTSTELTILQPNSAIGGTDVETVEELRANASSANLRQDRIVSLEDYRSFCNQAFSDYIIKTQVLSYKDIAGSGFIPDYELEKYWFNYIFIVAVPKYGNTISKIHHDLILDTLNKKFKSMATVEHELFSANVVPIDVRIRLKLTATGNGDSVQSSIKLALQNYFNTDNHEMGETVEYGPIEKIVLDMTSVETAEISIMKQNPNLSESDLSVDAVTSATETVQDVKRRKVMEILAKDPSLLTIIDPLFSVTDASTNVKSWVFSANVELNKYEFPVEGRVLIEIEE